MYEQPPLLTALLKSLDDMQAIDITVIDVRNQTTITDYMVVCCGRSSRHVKAVATEVMEKMKHSEMPALNHSGLEGGDWALVDFGDYILHVMQREIRDFYNLEGLWQQPESLK